MGGVKKGGGVELKCQWHLHCSTEGQGSGVASALERDWGEHQSTVEVECEGCIPLGVLISREQDGSISTSAYRKPTHADKYLDFDSHHPLSHKRSVTNTLRSRAKSHCSSDTTKTSEVKHISCALQLNGYPRTILQDPTTPRTFTRTPEEQKGKAIAVIPYIQGMSEGLRCILTPLRVRVCFKPFSTIKQLLSHPKDAIPDLQRSNSVQDTLCQLFSLIRRTNGTQTTTTHWRT